MRATTTTNFSLASPAAASTPDDWGKMVGDLGSIRPAHQSRTSRVADFIFRKDRSALAPDALKEAQKAHTSARFQKALSRQDDHRKPVQTHEAMTELIKGVRPGNGKTGNVFARTKVFAASNRNDVAILLAEDNLLGQLHVALVKNGMGATRATQRANAIYTGLVAQFAAGNETKRHEYYQDELNLITRHTKTPAEQLKLLADLEGELKEETGMSKAGVASVASSLAELRGQLEQSAEMLDKLISISTAGVTVDTPAIELDKRLQELDAHFGAIEGGTNLDKDAGERLKARVMESRTFLNTLKTRSRDLQELASHPRLQGALRDITDTRQYAAARQGLTLALDHAGPLLRDALLTQLGSLIANKDQAPLLTEMGAGEPGYVDMLLPGAIWDELALALKSCALNPSDDHRPAAELARVNVQVQHERRVLTRQLDGAMQSAASKSSKPIGKNNPGFANNAFQALKVNEGLINYLLKLPITEERNLAIANWVRLSLHDTVTGKSDPDECKKQFSRLAASGVNVEHMELHAAQGFKSSADVLACANQIRAFSAALASSSDIVAKVDANVRASDVGVELLGKLGIHATSLDDPSIDGKTKQLVTDALRNNADTDNLFRALRRVAILQVAVKSGDPKFTPAGSGPQGTYSELVMRRMAGMGMDFQSPHPVMQKTLKHLQEKLPKDKRDLAALCSAADPGSLSKRLGSGLKTAFGAKPAVQLPAEPRVTNDAPTIPTQRAAQKRREATEATFKAALTQLKPNEAITISFGTAGELSISTPVLPGLTAGADMSVEKHNSIRVSRSEGSEGTEFSVELLAGVSTREGASITAVMDTLNIRAGTTHDRDKGYKLLFAQRSDCEAFLVDVANNVAPSLRGARSVEAATYAGRSAEVSVTATADIKIATLSATLAAAVGETRSVHESGSTTREVFSRHVAAQAVLSAATAGDFASGQVGVGMELEVRRAIVKTNEMLAAGADSPTLSMVAVVTRGNLQRSLGTLLPDASEAQRRSIEALLGQPPDGTELFTRFRLTDEARVQANVLLGEADSLLRAARISRSEVPPRVLELVRQADAVTRSASNYTPEGFGWTVRSGSSVEKSRGIFKKSAQREGEQNGFVKFDATASGSPAVGKSVLLSLMS